MYVDISWPAVMDGWIILALTLKYEVCSLYVVLIRMAPGPEDAGYELESAVTRHARTSPCLSHH